MTPIDDEQTRRDTSTRRSPASDWWRQAVVYQVYSRSFADGNGDGIGDFAGVLSKVDYLASLGIDAVWFNPFYPSALADGGYDVDDHRNVDPAIGTLEEFDAVVASLHERGIKVIVDIVPNHSSNRHAWFLEALAAAPGSAARQRYLFRDGRGADGALPPSDWQAIFGGPAWTRVPDGQWYYHMFTPNQPDWNWSNPEVRADHLATIRFWADRGVDGFRIDVAMGLAKDLSEPFPDWADVVDDLPLPFVGRTRATFADGQNPIYDRDELDDIYEEWRRLFDSYDPPRFAVAEAWVEPHRRLRYSHPQRLGQAFNFDLLTAEWSAAQFAEIIDRNLRLAASSSSSSTWVFSNHDFPRHATRFTPTDASHIPRAQSPQLLDEAAAAIGLARATAATALSLALPGSAYLYQGEELGLPEVTDIPADRRQDPQSKVGDAAAVGRDGCRVPLPWTSDAPFFGFSHNASHLPQPAWFGGFSVEREASDAASTLALYRRALSLRRRLQADEGLEWIDLGPHVLAFRRPNGWVSVTNFGISPIALPPGALQLTTSPLDERAALPPNTTAWLLQTDQSVGNGS